MVSRFVSLTRWFPHTDWGPHRRADPHGKNFYRISWYYVRSRSGICSHGGTKTYCYWVLEKQQPSSYMLSHHTWWLFFLKTPVSFCFPCVLNWWWASNLRSRSKRFYSFLTGGCGSSRGWQTGLIYIYIHHISYIPFFLNTVYYMLHIIMYIIYIMKHALYFTYYICSYHWYL